MAPTCPSACVGREQTLAALELDLGQAVAGRPGPADEQVRARELRDERARRRGDQLGGRTDLHELALVEHADPVGERGCVLVVVRDDDRREPARPQVSAQLGADVRACLGVERAERLVEEQDRGLARECARERDTLALAARESAGPLIRERGQAVRLDQLGAHEPARRRRRSSQR